MTDVQIIKGLELCFAEKGTTHTCAVCPYHKFGKLCKIERDRDALDLIIRQQKELEAKHAHILCLDKEVERLTKELSKAIVENVGLFSTLEEKMNLARKLPRAIAEIRAEAINSYHDEVKKRCIEGGIFPAFVRRQMEDVRKEMVGE